MYQWRRRTLPPGYLTKGEVARLTTEVTSLERDTGMRQGLTHIARHVL
jgi:hypothetical protein